MSQADTPFAVIKQCKHPKLKCIEEIAKSNFKNDNTKINADGLTAFTDVIKVFIGEAATRAALEAKKDCVFEILVTKEHLEKIIPQLLLHF